MKHTVIKFEDNEFGLTDITVDEKNKVIIEAPDRLSYLNDQPYWFSYNGKRIMSVGRHDNEIYEINANIIDYFEVSHETVH